MYVLYCVVLYCILLFCSVSFLIIVPLLSIITTATTRIQTNRIGLVWFGSNWIVLYCCVGDDNALIVPRFWFRLWRGCGCGVVMVVVVPDERILVFIITKQ